MLMKRHWRISPFCTFYVNKACPIIIHLKSSRDQKGTREDKEQKFSQVKRYGTARAGILSYFQSRVIKNSTYSFWKTKNKFLFVFVFYELRIVTIAWHVSYFVVDHYLNQKEQSSITRVFLHGGGNLSKGQVWRSDLGALRSGASCLSYRFNGSH